MDDSEADMHDAVTILDVIGLWPCARAVFEHVPVRDLVRSERVSRRWQRAVHDHLRGCSLSFINVRGRYPERNRRIGIPDTERFWPIVCKTVGKLGPYIVSLITNRCDENYIRTIAETCPNLQRIEFCAYRPRALAVIQNFGEQFQNCHFEYFNKLKHISLIDFEILPDLQLCRPFQTIHCETIEIDESNLTGSFLTNIKTNNLKSLSLCNVLDLDINELLSAVCSLKNLTSLELNYNSMELFSDIHLLLNEMPKLEELSLRGYDYMELSKEFIDSFRRLVHLKRLNFNNNRSVNSALLKALAGCRKLEDLDLTFLRRECAPGVAALLHRPLPAVTTLCLGDVNNFTSEQLAAYIKSFPVMRELEALGLVELTPQWLEAMSRASQGRYYPLRLRARCNAGQTEVQRDLQIHL